MNIVKTMKYEFEKFEYYERADGELISADEEGRREMMRNVVNSIQQELDTFITEEDKKKPEHMRMTRQNMYDMVCNLTCDYDDGNLEKSLDRIFALLTIFNTHLYRVNRMPETEDNDMIGDS